MSDQPRSIAVLGDGAAAAAIVAACTAADCRVVETAGDADLVVESLALALEPTVEALRRVDAEAPKTALIATTSAIHPVTELAAALEDPGRLAGLHLLGQPGAEIVELVAGEQTRETTITALTAFVEALGRRAVLTRDRPGFLVNRVLVPYLNQALQAFDDGIATREDIDTAVKLGLGYPVGPLALLDRSGLDAHLELASALHEQTGDAHFAPPPLLARLVAAGHLGEKAGRGLYDHEEEEA